MDSYKFFKIIEFYAPLNIAFDYDDQKIGIVLNLLKYKNNIINNVGFCVDITNNIVKKARDDNLDIIVCHHNPFFDMKYKIDDDTIEYLKILFEKNISLYCAHTNYDNSINGMNYSFSKFLNLKNLCFIDGIYIGEPKNNYTTMDIINNISKELNIPHFSYIGDENKLIKKILICCGSGFTRDNLNIAKKQNVDMFISSEWKHNTIIRKREDIVLVNISHYDMENIGMIYLSNIIKKITNLNVRYYNDNINLKTI